MVWEKLAEAYKDREDLRLAKFDATSNDLDDGEEIEDFPTVILYRKTDNQEIDYRGKVKLYSIKFYTPFQAREITTAWQSSSKPENLKNI